LIVFAAWIATARRRGALEYIGFAVAATIIYFSHIFGAALLALLIVCFELGDSISATMQTWPRIIGRICAAALIFAPAAIAFAFRPAGSSDAAIEFNLPETASDRIEAALDHYCDHPAYLLLVVLIIGATVLLWARRAALHPRLQLLLIVLGACAALAPEWAMGGWGIDLRLPPVFFALLFASIELRMPARAAAAFGVVAIALLSWNAAVLAKDWTHYDAQVREFRAALKDVPSGTRLLTVLDGDAIGKRSDQPYWHLGELAIVDRQAFTQLMFTTKGQHVILLRPPYDSFAAQTARQGSPPDITELDDLSNGQIDGDEDIATVFPYLMYFQCHFDEALVIHLGGPRSAVPDLLHVRHEGSFFTLYDIAKTPACAGK
jgi:hypothetical protein